MGKSTVVKIEKSNVATSSQAIRAWLNLFAVEINRDPSQAIACVGQMTQELKKLNQIAVDYIEKGPANG